MSYEANLNNRQREQYTALESIANRYGKWDATTGADGAHYAPAANNPFISEGLVCANCVFYEQGGQCEIVNGTLPGGNVEPNAVCKLWIIPADGNAAIDQTAAALLQLMRPAA